MLTYCLIKGAHTLSNSGGFFIGYVLANEITKATQRATIT